MTTANKIRDKKLEYGINREAANISTLHFGKIDKCEYLTDEETLPLDQKKSARRS